MSRFNSMFAVVLFGGTLALAVIAMLRVYRFMGALIEDFEKLHRSGTADLLRQQRRSAMIGLAGTLLFTAVFWWALHADLGPCW